MVWFCFAIFCVALSASYYVYKKGTQNEDYFVGKGIKYLKPRFIFGNTGEAFSMRTLMTDFMAKLYSKFPGEK